MIKNIKLQVETDEQNQYVLNKLLDVNKNPVWIVYLDGGYDYFYFQDLDGNRAFCSVWKGFRHLVVDDSGDFFLCVFKDDFEEREEKEITFEQFKEMVEEKKDE